MAELTTKYRLAEQAVRILSGGGISKDNNTKVQEMTLFVGQARDNLARQELWQSIRVGDNDIAGEFITSECLQVECDEKLCQFFLSPKLKPLRLPNDMGIYQVSYVKDQSTPFVPIHSGAKALYRNLGAGQLEGRKGYWYERDRIYLEGFDEQSFKGVEILVKMVAASTTIDDDEFFPVPADLEARVIEMAVQLFSAQVNVPHDEINDNQG